MKTSWMIGLWIVFIGGNILSGILELQYLGGEASSTAVLYNIMNPPVNLTILAVLGLVWDWIKAIWDMFTWNYAFFSGGYAIIKWMLLYPLSIGVVVSLVLAVRGTSSG